MTTLVGLNATGSQSVYGSYSPNNGVIASLFTASQSGTATSIFARVSLNSGYTYRCAIYNAAGTTKLGDTVAVSDSGAPGWIQFNLNASVSITSGTNYCLAIMSNDAYLWLEADSSGFSDLETTGNTYPTWPSSLNLGSSPGNGVISIYADGTSSGSSFTLTVENASVALTAQDVGTQFAILIDSGSLGLSGSDVSLVSGLGLTVDQSNLALSGQDVTLVAGASFTVPVVEAALTLEVEDVAFNFDTPWIEGTLTLTGQDITLTAGIPVTLTVTEGALSLTGQDVVLNVDIDYILAVAEGALSLAGQDVTLSALTSLTIQVDTSPLLLSGQNVGLFTPFATGGSSKGRGTRRRGAIKVIGR